MDLFPTKLLIESYDASHVSRLFVIGDIHGCYEELMNKLLEVNFNFEEDMVISVGDLVDRGKDSLKCIELVKKTWFKAIRGNHEQMCLEASIASEMKGFHCKHGGEWLYELSTENYKEVLSVCLNLPIVLEIAFRGKKYGFVHADIKQNDWSEFKNNILKKDYFSESNSSTLQSALWGRSRISAKYPYKYQEIVGVDKVYLGHTVVDIPVQLNNCVYIDTGMVFGGELTIGEVK
ncbi:metallophosphoesterase [Acinetobacter baumannii]